MLIMKEKGRSRFSVAKKHLKKYHMTIKWTTLYSSHNYCGTGFRRSSGGNRDTVEAMYGFSCTFPKY